MFSAILNQIHCIIEKGNIVDYIQTPLILLILFLIALVVFLILTIFLMYPIYFINEFFILPENERFKDRFMTSLKIPIHPINPYIPLIKYIRKYGGIKKLLSQSFKNPFNLGIKVFSTLNLVISFGIAGLIFILVILFWIASLFDSNCNFL